MVEVAGVGLVVVVLILEVAQLLAMEVQAHQQLQLGTKNQVDMTQLTMTRIHPTFQRVEILILRLNQMQKCLIPNSQGIRICIQAVHDPWDHNQKFLISITMSAGACQLRNIWTFLLKAKNFNVSLSIINFFKGLVRQLL